MTRRKFLKVFALATAAPSALIAESGPAVDEAFLDDLQRRGFRYFVEQADPKTGLIREGARSDGFDDTPGLWKNASVSATGFGLAILCVAAERHWCTRREAKSRVLAALRTIADHTANERGWCYHWVDMASGVRNGSAGNGGISEVSSIDHAFLLAGIITAREYFHGDREVADLADRIYHRVDFPWMLVPKTARLDHGWTPETGFLQEQWDSYSEASVLYLLGIGTPVRPIPPATWYAWERTANTYGAYRFVGTQQVFTFQYSHAFVDFRGRREHGGTGIDWFANSQVATLAHRQFCIDLAGQFPDYGPDLWGISPSDGPNGYERWGGPPRVDGIDGSVVPSAVGGSLMLEPAPCLAALQAMKKRFGTKIYGRYGFADAFNPLTGWVAPHVYALDLGIAVLAAENLRTGNIWRWFMAAPEVQRAMRLAQIT